MLQINKLSISSNNKSHTSWRQRLHFRILHAKRRKLPSMKTSTKSRVWSCLKI